MHRAFPDLHFVGLCHEIASLYQHLPLILDTPIENLSFRAGGLNHFSVLTDIHYVDSGKDAYPEVLEKAPDYFEKAMDFGHVMKKAWNAVNEIEMSAEEEIVHPWSERGVFRVLLEKFHCLPITTDSHIGEYVPWGQDAADHRAVMEFYVCLLYTSPSPRDATLSRMPSSA